MKYIIVNDGTPHDGNWFLYEESIPRRPNKLFCVNADRQLAPAKWVDLEGVPNDNGPITINYYPEGEIWLAAFEVVKFIPNKEHAELVTFSPENGGSIQFEYDAQKYVSCCEWGTSVKLGETFLAFVPDEKSRCCEGSHPQRDFIDDRVQFVGTETEPAFVGKWSDSQEYAVKYECWVVVYLYDYQKLMDKCPSGHKLAECSEQDGCVTVQNFLS